jgi:hypothetical protein
LIPFWPARKITTLIAGLGFLLNRTIFFLVLSRGRILYHFLFAGILIICALWDLGILLAMLRNDFDQELYLIGYLTMIPCVFLLPMIFHNHQVAQPGAKTRSFFLG